MKTRTAEGYYIITNNKNTRLSEHFKAGEFQCRDGTIPIIINYDLIEVLEEIRNQTGKPILVSSGYRTQEYNRKIGGAELSYHMYGCAADIWSMYHEPRELAKIADEVMDETGGIIVHDTYVHIDVRSDKYREGV